jgi:hypothetical protein
LDKVGVGSLVGSKNFASCSVFERFCMDVVGIIGIEDKKVIVSCGGLNWEFSCLVCVDLSAGDFQKEWVDIVCLSSLWEWEWEVIFLLLRG